MQIIYIYIPQRLKSEDDDGIIIATVQYNNININNNN